MSGFNPGFNHRAIWAIYKFELHRFSRTLLTGLLVPVNLGM